MEKSYSVKPEDVQIDQSFWIEDIEGGRSGKFSEFICKEVAVVTANGIIEIKAICVETKTERFIKINRSFPREIFVQKLNTEWRKL